MIHAIGGRPGSGKSMTMVETVILELRMTQRFICTNLPLKLEPLENLLIEKYGSTFDVRNRLRLLTTDESFEFWLYPAPGVKLVDEIEVRSEKKGLKIDAVKRTDFSARNGMQGTLFVIDEAQEFFGARSWQGRAEDFQYYLTQHRKLSDDVYWISQSFSLVDKQMRAVTQDFTFIRNLGVEKFGIFAMPNRRLVQLYLDPPGPATKPMSTALKCFDFKTIGSVYDTAAGAGIAGGTADIGIKRKKSLGFKSLCVCAALGVIALAFVPSIIGKTVSKAAFSGVTPYEVPTNFAGGLAAATGIMPPMIPGQAMGPGTMVSPNGSTIKIESVAGGFTAVNPGPKSIFLTGIVGKPGGGFLVYLDNGRKFTSDDRELQYVGRDFVFISGQRVEFAPMRDIAQKQTNKEEN